VDVTARRFLAALAGAVAAGAALAVGELITAFDGTTSLVTAVGDEFVDRFAASLKDVAIELFGTNDKVALVSGIVVVAILIGAAIGVATLRRPWVGPLAFAGFAVLGAWAYAKAPLASDAAGVSAALAAGITGTAALWWLVRLQTPRSAPLVRPADDGVAGPDGDVLAAPRPVGGPTDGPSRRTVLTATMTVAGAAAGLAVISRRARGEDPTVAARASLGVPPPVRTVDVPRTSWAAADVGGISPYITPTPDFFRIDTALTLPRVDLDGWSLDISGLVESPLTLTMDDLLGMDAVEVPVTLQCVSNEVGGDLVDTAVWQGVPLEALLDRVRPSREATQVVGRSVDGFSAGFPTAVIGDGRTALVAYAMNGEPLPVRHGFPARLVVAGLYGYVSATKWLERIELARWEDVDGYWVPRGWSKEGPIKTASRIDVPRSGATVLAGPTAVAGVAWAPTRGIRAVEVRVDDGPWEPCELGEVASDETWVQWWWRWDATPGEHVLAVRATDGRGAVQTAEIAPPAPDGATGLHARRVEVRSP
jgi:DMSO/TMAO reductase YedYZ molybdopterin-dependent catalytic subunit